MAAKKKPYKEQPKQVRRSLVATFIFTGIGIYVLTRLFKKASENDTEQQGNTYFTIK